MRIRTALLVLGDSVGSLVPAVKLWLRDRHSHEYDWVRHRGVRKILNEIYDLESKRSMTGREYDLEKYVNKLVRLGSSAVPSLVQVVEKDIVITDERPAVDAAALALGSMNDARGLEGLLGVRELDSELTIAVAIGIRKHKRDDLASNLVHSHPGAGVLEELGPIAVPHLREFLQSHVAAAKETQNVPYIAFSDAAEALAAIDSHRSAALLIRLISDPDQPHPQLIWSLRHCGPTKEVSTFLKDRLKNGSVEASEVLCRFGDPDSISAVIEAMSTQSAWRFNDSSRRSRLVEQDTALLVPVCVQKLFEFGQYDEFPITKKEAFDTLSRLVRAIPGRISIEDLTWIVEKMPTSVTYFESVYSDWSDRHEPFPVDASCLEIKTMAMDELESRHKGRA